MYSRAWAWYTWTRGWRLWCTLANVGRRLGWFTSSPNDYFMSGWEEEQRGGGVAALLSALALLFQPFFQIKVLFKALAAGWCCATALRLWRSFTSLHLIWVWRWFKINQLWNWFQLNFWHFNLVFGLKLNWINLWAKRLKTFHNFDVASVLRVKPDIQLRFYKII